jgi:lipoprotein-anchoring transpeptidase ErfK/SrfK
VLQEIAPVAVGEQIDTGEYVSTQTGLFHVYNKIEELAYDAAYDTYISHWIGFDPEKDNGFHSFLKDASGALVDASTGRVSNGCIRTGDPELIYAFAEIGTPVWVHE